MSDDPYEETLMGIFRLINSIREENKESRTQIERTLSIVEQMQADVRFLTSRAQRTEQTVEAQEGVLNSVLERLDRVIEEVRRARV